MAAPPQVTLDQLSGTWKLNKKLSDDIEPILALQGTNTLIRKAISSASVTLHVTQPDKDKYEIKQSATAVGIPGTTEQYILDWEWRENHDAFFGDVKGRSRWAEQSEFQGRVANEWEEGGKLIAAAGGSVDGKWNAMRIWGFELTGGGGDRGRRWTQR